MRKNGSAWTWAIACGAFGRCATESAAGNAAAYDMHRLCENQNIRGANPNIATPIIAPVGVCTPNYLVATTRMRSAASITRTFGKVDR